MRYIYDARADEPVINALFIQPTYWCAMKCSNCYVKAHKHSGEQVTATEMGRLFRRFYYGTGGYCNQITISMDSIPRREDRKAWFDQFISRLSEIYVHTTLFRFHKTRDLPEVHMTFRNPPAYREYEKCWDYILGMVTMITFSEIVEGDLPWIVSLKKRFPSLKVNYNHMIPTYLTNGSWQEHIGFLKKVLQVGDSIYLVLEKSPLGEARDLLQFGLERKRMFHTLQYFKRIQEDLQSDKVIVDGCITDTVESCKSGHGCSSSISRFQVWPDGGVSGCAYSKESRTPPASTAEGIIENIRKARETYDFRMCHLPSTYRSLQENKKPTCTTTEMVTR
jgi:hypothetical protein